MGNEIFSRAINFFREDLREVIGAYFDGEKIFITRFAEKIETVEIYADDSEPEQLAEKISLECRQRGWNTQAVGFCLREGDVVTYQTAVDNLPEKEIPAFVKSWAVAQAGKDSAYSSTKIGGELWIESMPRSTLNEFCAAFKKFGVNLRGLSVMPAEMLTKITPLSRTEFIAQVVRNKKSPNLLATRGSAWNSERISLTVAACVTIFLLIGSIKILFDLNAAETQLDAAKNSLNAMQEDFALKQTLDADISELNRLNKIISAQNLSPTQFNLLINLGKVAGGGMRLTKIRSDENFFELEGISTTPDAVKSYLSRVKNSVNQNARLKSSIERDDGNISFVIQSMQ